LANRQVGIHSHNQVQRHFQSKKANIRVMVSPYQGIQTEKCRIPPVNIPTNTATPHHLFHMHIPYPPKPQYTSQHED
jgi:hypothetical protein